MRALLIAVALASCAPYKPVPTDGGTTQDVAVKEAAACVPDFSACNAQSICCTGTFVCSAGLCQKACLGVGSICGVNGDCCTGICNGTCE